MIADEQEIPCGVKNCLIYFKCRAPTDDELERLTPIVLSQGEVPWNPMAEKHSSPINDDFHKEVIAAAEADVQAKMEEDQVLMAVQQAADDHEVKTTRIFNCLMEMDEKLRQDEKSGSDGHLDSLPSSNNSATHK